jgi:hypothetical protein
MVAFVKEREFHIFFAWEPRFKARVGKKTLPALALVLRGEPMMNFVHDGYNIG